MKLMTYPGACSTADHIALQWTGRPFEVEIMNRDTLASARFRALNPAGTVPAIVDGDYVLTQNIAILTYIAETYPHAGLFGDGSAMQRAETMRWLALGCTDIHPVFGVFFAPAIVLPDADRHDALKAAAAIRLRKMFERADAQLDGREWFTGFRSAADAYLYVMLRWAEMHRLDMSGLDRLQAFKQRMEADPGVRAALQAEGLEPIAEAA
ncbi:glutathione S-transferase N-terminal domain-containing protein [Luteimonas sp. SX5]|uniref:Glutathione S-transferase N-terminal domain-containing protein n=1 Tax=Luteimonas galliterrae TaxID=2940486 RepID=A0ABT0MJW5_9GAMM|nr:glutathione S-transferase N-terminal domain-containing protein [Luteimonas galliterrae]MCL1635174.1 glutathione S-transferase N-terminal domain-containing protein [Luteimonas galliterrae]